MAIAAVWVRFAGRPVPMESEVHVLFTQGCLLYIFDEVGSTHFIQSTKAYVPWEIVYSESFGRRSENVARERYLKALKSRVKLEELIGTSR